VSPLNEFVNRFFGVLGVKVSLNDCQKIYNMNRLVTRITSHSIMAIPTPKFDCVRSRFSPFSRADRFPQNISFARREHNDPQRIPQCLVVYIVPGNVPFARGSGDYRKSFAVSL
jgi:hypothetical protein